MSRDKCENSVGGISNTKEISIPKEQGVDKSQNFSQIKEGIIHRALHVASNATTAAGVSFFAILPHRTMLDKIQNHNISYPTILSNIKSGRGEPLYKGFVSYAIWQALSSGLGYTGADTLIENGFSKKTHEGVKVAVSGVVMGAAEAVVTSKNERSWLASIVKDGKYMPTNRYIAMATARNSPGWIVGGMAGRFAVDSDLTSSQSAVASFMLGAIAGGLSMPLQKALVGAVANGNTAFWNYQNLFNLSCREVFAGACARGVFMAPFTAAAFCANKFTKEQSGRISGEGNGQVR